MHDALIVLGYSNDTEDPVVRARLDKAIALYEQGLAAHLIMSGCCSDKLDIRPKITEAAAMQDYAIERGIPPSIIMLEEESVDTLGNFYFTKTRILEPCSWYHVGFVSTPWHCHRSDYLAAMVLGEDYTCTAYESEHPDGWDEPAIRESERYNRDLLEQARSQLADITPGDHEAIAAHLGRTPAGH